jgi:hypothetical protein
MRLSNDTGETFPFGNPSLEAKERALENAFAAPPGEALSHMFESGYDRGHRFQDARFEFVFTA